MNKPVSKVFPAVAFTQQDRAAYAAIKLTAAEVESVVKPASKPAQQ